MHILAASDQRYAPHMAVMVHSLLQNNAAAPDIVLHIALDAPAMHKDLIRAVCERFGRTFVDLPIPERARSFPSNKVHGNASPSTYVRCCASEVLGPGLDRVLYLDSDMIVRQPLDALWTTELGAASLAASACHATIKRDDFMAGFDNRYFNSGMMLMNLDAWRARDIPAACTAFAERHPEKIVWWDQCVLNHVCADWMFVDVTWNYSTQLGPKHAPRLGMTPERFEAIGRDPAVFHFIGSRKPWSKPEAEAEGLEREYWRYRRALEAELGVDLSTY